MALCRDAAVEDVAMHWEGMLGILVWGCSMSALVRAQGWWAAGIVALMVCP